MLSVYERKVAAGVQLFAFVQGEASAEAYGVMHLAPKEFAKVRRGLQGFTKDNAGESPEERAAEFHLPD
jgi:hypothetical protein